MSTSKTSILIVEDDDALREALVDTAEIAGFNTLAARDGSEALKVLEGGLTDLVITDIQMAPMDGHELLAAIRQRWRDLPVVLMTAYESVSSAVSALRNGAVDYLIKPFEAEVLSARIEQWLPAVATPPNDIVAVDPAMRQVMDLVTRVAQSDATVMLTGESGVGKEVVFRALHQQSARAAETPVAVNCAAIPDNMLEAVLFGYEKGAFTGAYKASPGKFEQAQHSSLLLDEVSEMPLALQAKLLRVLQERQVERLGSNRLIELDVRIVATSNRNLKEEVAAGNFREDLYYRLNVMPIAVPPLRDRPDDIIPLAQALLSRAAHSNGKPVPELGADARMRLLEHGWPGNVRELDNVMQRALIIGTGDQVTAADLVFEACSVTDQATAERTEPQLGSDLKDHERRLILSALSEGGGSRKFAAEKLGIAPRTLRYKIARMRESGIAVPGTA